MTYIPKEITQDIDTCINIASFSYYDGINYAKSRNLEQSNSFSDVNKGSHFIVCCGDVMIKVDSNEFPEITRRIF